MPFWLARKAAPHLWKRVPWKMVWAASLWLVEQGRERIDRNLTKQERSDFLKPLQRAVSTRTTW